MKPMDLLFLSSEVVPFAKTGGLADVAGALPPALKSLGQNVKLVTPFYGMTRDRDFKIRRCLDNIEIPLGEKTLSAGVLETVTDDDISVYFLEREDLYGRSNLYGDASGDYEDNLERFAFLAHGALRLTDALSFKPDVIHCHDWQTGLVPALMKGPYGNAAFFKDTRTVFTIHNLGYQGVFPAEKFPLTGLSRDGFLTPEGLEYWDEISLLKAGIVYSDVITTVSPTYAKEIQTHEYGMGMDGVLQHRRALLHGILNGVDYSLWDPATDSHIPANYTPEEIAGKDRCKEAIIRELGLDKSLVKRPLLGVISRLDAQKGFDLLVQIVNEIIELDVGLVVLGLGDEKISEAMEAAVRRYPDHVRLKLAFDEPLAHRIMAGADLFLIPSRYEPCGLTQMYALKYGTVPLVRATGGLEDTVSRFDPQTGTGNGLNFGPYEPMAFLEAIKEGVNLFKDTGLWGQLRANGMKMDFSWHRSAQRYLELYQSIVDGS